jgi:hypothetical protein
MGGKCFKCGEKNPLVLEFHHFRDKQFDLSEEGSISSDRFKLELAKCILLCARCHREESFGGLSGRSALKQTLIGLIGKPLCFECGYQGRNTASLEFHHREKLLKRFTIGRVCRGNSFTLPLDVVITEAKKCNLLCSNCHALHHVDVERFKVNKDRIEELARTYGVWKHKNRIDDNCVASLCKRGLSQADIAKEMGKPKGTVTCALIRLGLHTAPSIIQNIQRDAKRIDLQKEFILTCVVCGSEFKVFGERARKKRTVCSSGKCAKKMVGYKDRPPKDELLKKLSELSVVQVASFYKVDQSTVYRWKTKDRWFKKGS